MRFCLSTTCMRFRLICAKRCSCALHQGRQIGYVEFGSLLRATALHAIVTNITGPAHSCNAHSWCRQFEREAAAWAETLDTLQTTLDAWRACQSTWQYLEPLFASPDIMRQLPEEAANFRGVDARWRDALAAASAAPAALEYGTSRESLDMFVESSAVLEEVRKGLARYLDLKRAAFPRCAARASSLPPPLLRRQLCLDALALCRHEQLRPSCLGPAMHRSLRVQVLLPVQRRGACHPVRVQGPGARSAACAPVLRRHCGSRVCTTGRRYCCHGQWGGRARALRGAGGATQGQRRCREVAVSGATI